MERMIAFCGITCSDCPALLATQKDDDSERKRVAEQWSKQYNTDMKPEDINCDGCVAVTGTRIAHWDECGIRKCCQERGFENCGHCEDYACEQLQGFFKMVPNAKAVLDEVRKTTKPE